jgi:superfamily I DNA and/or RNA helicase
LARALKEGILSEFESLCRQEDLDLPQGVDLRDARSRFQAWLQLRERSAVEQTKRFLSDWLEFLRQNPSFFSELLCGGGNVVCGTTVGCVTHPGLRSAVYDYAIIDEAGKEETRRILIPMVRARRWILVGDHQQLPPFADDRLQRRIREEGMDPELIFRSLFEELQPVLAQKGRFVFLDRQGRMHPEISAFVSMQFYGGQLKDFPNVSQHNLPAPSFLEACLGRVPHIVVLDTQDLPDRYEKREGFGYLNPLEVRLVVVLLEAYAKLPGFRAEATHRDPPTIGVIAPYRHQVKELERRILRSSSLRYLLEMGQLQIGTVDSFQGQEKDLVIFSTTRSNPEGRLGFVDNRQRLNVAFSRARAQLVVIMDGSTVLLARQRGDSRDLEAEIRDHLYALWEYAAKIGGWVRLDSQHLAGFQGLSL